MSGKKQLTSSKNNLSIGLRLATLAAAISPIGCATPEAFHKQPNATPYTCEATRKECVAEATGGDGIVICTNYELATRRQTACVPAHGDAEATCSQEMCTPPDTPYPNYMECTAHSIRSTLPSSGVCVEAPVAAGHRLSRVAAVDDWRICFASGGVCGELRPHEALLDSCLNLSTEPALVKLVRSGAHDQTFEIMDIVNDSPDCPAVGVAAGTTAAFDLAPGPIGAASGAGVSAPLAAKRGFAVLDQSCDGEVCTDVLSDLRLDLNDTSVAGVPLTSVVVKGVSPTPVGQVPDGYGGYTTGFPADSLSLMVRGKFNGVDSFYNVSNHSPWLLNRTSSALSLGGTLEIQGTSSGGAQLPVAVTVSLSGQPSTAGSKACALLTPSQRLFGFEDPLDFTTTNASLSLVTTPTTQGCGALGVAGKGFISINAGVFSTVGLAVKPAASVDLYIPGNQPNPYWLGAAQMYLSCPSGNVVNQYIGQLELTGKPVGAFSTLRFPLPAPTQATLRRSLSDCSFGFTLNVNPTGRTWVLDNLRLTQ